MTGVAALAPYPEARHGRPLASERVRSLLDVEVAPKARATGAGCLDSRPDSTDESSQQAVGSTENPWRAHQVGNRSGAIDCWQVSAANAQPTLAYVANVPHESHGADGFDGLLHGADGHLSGAIRFPRVVARSATHIALEHNGTPDGGVDRATASRSFSLGGSAALFDPRSRCDFRERNWRNDQGHGHRSRSYGSAISLAKSICGAADRIHSPRVFGSRCVKKTRPASCCARDEGWPLGIAL